MVYNYVRENIPILPEGDIRGWSDLKITIWLWPNIAMT